MCWAEVLMLLLLDDALMGEAFTSLLTVVLAVAVAVVVTLCWHKRYAPLCPPGSTAPPGQGQPWAAGGARAPPAVQRAGAGAHGEGRVAAAGGGGLAGRGPAQGVHQTALCSPLSPVPVPDKVGASRALAECQRSCCGGCCTPYCAAAPSLGSSAAPSSSRSSTSSGSTQQVAQQVAQKAAADYLFAAVGRHWVVDPHQVHIVKRVGNGSWGDVHLGVYHDTLVAVKSFRRRPQHATARGAQHSSVARTTDYNTDGQPVQHSMLQATASTAAGGDRGAARGPLAGGDACRDEEGQCGWLLAPELRTARQEVSALSQLRHPNVVAFMGITLDPPCMMMEFCHQGSLWHVMRRARNDPRMLQRLDWTRRLGMAIDAAKAMQFLHSGASPVVHRDLRSPNLLVARHWTVKVADLGMSRQLDGGGQGAPGAPPAHLTFMNPKWCAPEVIQQLPFLLSSDVYSFGIVMWELMTLQEPFGKMTPMQVACAVVNDGRRPEIPADLASIPGGPFPLINDYLAIVRDCWAQDPEQRPAFQCVHRRLRVLRKQAVACMAPLAEAVDGP